MGLVLVVVIVVVAAAAVVIVAMTVRVSVIMLMVMIVGVCMAVTMIIVAVVVAASLAWRVIMSAIMLGLGRLLGCQQGGYSLSTVVIGLGGELVDRGQRLESHGL